MTCSRDFFVMLFFYHSDGLFLKGLTMGYRWGHAWVIDQLDMIWDLYSLGEMAM